jgi:hypothetical protein
MKTPTVIRADTAKKAQVNAGPNLNVATSASKAQVRKVTNYSRAKDFTSRDAQNFREAGLTVPRPLNYDKGDSFGFLEKIVSQDYASNGHAWKSYLRSVKKELELVDGILATGGSGQGESLDIPKEYGSKFRVSTSKSNLFREKDYSDRS